MPAFKCKTYRYAPTGLLAVLVLVACGGGGGGDGWLNHVKAIKVTPANPTLAKGLTQTFIATATWEDGSTLDMSSQVTWTSSNASVATVNAVGVATTIAAGTTTITATMPGGGLTAAGATIIGSTSLMVTGLPPPSVSVSPASVTLAAGGSQQFTVSAAGSPTTAVTWEVNGVAGGDATHGAITASGLYVAPIAAGTVSVSAVSAADQSVLGSAAVAILQPHRFGVRTTATVAEFYDRLSGSAFVPRGNNYIRLAWMTDTQGRYNLYHSTFNVGLYDAQRSEAALAAMQANGYNVVTVWLDGCCTGGIGDPAGGLSKPYILNLVDFLTRAKAHNIAVITASSWLPDLGGYGDYYAPCGSQFLDVNGTNLSSCGVKAAQIFFHDLVQALVDAGAPMDAIFGYDLWDEYFYNLNFIPLSATSGTVTAANGQTYDMSLPASKQQMMDDGVVYFADQVRAAIKALDPTALVTISFFQPEGPNPSRIGDPRMVPAYPSIARSTLDYVDLHMYPVVSGLTMAQMAQNFGFVGYQQKQPIVMGEFGAFISAYPTISDAAAGLQAWQIQSCAYDIKGWSLWTWDEENAAASIWNATAGDGSINRALGPTFRPDACTP